jgi:uridylate kinase
MKTYEKDPNLYRDYSDQNKLAFKQIDSYARNMVDADSFKFGKDNHIIGIF